MQIKCFRASPHYDYWRVLIIMHPQPHSTREWHLIIGMWDTMKPGSSPPQTHTQKWVQRKKQEFICTCTCKRSRIVSEKSMDKQGLTTNSLNVQNNSLAESKFCTFCLQSTSSPSILYLAVHFSLPCPQCLINLVWSFYLSVRISCVDTALSRQCQVRFSLSNGATLHLFHENAFSV